MLVRYGENGLLIDASLDVSGFLGMEWAGLLAAEKLTGERNEKAHRLASSLLLMRLRIRFNSECYGPYLIKSEAPPFRGRAGAGAPCYATRPPQGIFERS